MNNEQNDVLERCNLFIDHQLSWAGDGYFCENCRVRFEPVPNERSEESAVQAERTRIIKALEKLRINPDGITRLGESYNEAIDQAIKAVGESAEKGGLK